MALMEYSMTVMDMYFEMRLNVGPSAEKVSDSLP